MTVRPTVPPFRPGRGSSPPAGELTKERAQQRVRAWRSLAEEATATVEAAQQAAWKLLGAVMDTAFQGLPGDAGVGAGLILGEVRGLLLHVRQAEDFLERYRQLRLVAEMPDPIDD